MRNIFITIILCTFTSYLYCQDLLTVNNFRDKFLKYDSLTSCFCNGEDSCETLFTQFNDTVLSCASKNIKHIHFWGDTMELKAFYKIKTILKSLEVESLKYIIDKNIILDSLKFISFTRSDLRLGSLKFLTHCPNLEYLGGMDMIVDDAIYLPKNIKFVILTGIHNKKLPLNLFTLPNLQEMCLQSYDCRFPKITHEIKGLKRLVILDDLNNVKNFRFMSKIITLEDILFYGCANVNKVDLTMFKYLKRMSFMDISDEKLAFLQQKYPHIQFSKNTKLKVFSFQ